jgi:Holliday junction resolvase RusA-like endonuclease
MLIATLSFCVNGPPVAWQRVTPVRLKTGKFRSLVPERTRDYEKRVAGFAQVARMRLRVRWPQAARWYQLSCSFYREADRGDLSNFIKAIEDGLNGVVWPDDRLVKSYGKMWMGVDPKNPRAEVTVEAFT